MRAPVRQPLRRSCGPTGRYSAISHTVKKGCSSRTSTSLRQQASSRRAANLPKKFRLAPATVRLHFLRDPGNLQPGGCMSTDRIEKKILLRAPRKRVWRALADSKEFGTWFGVKFDGPFAPGASMRGVIVPTTVNAEVAN